MLNCVVQKYCFVAVPVYKLFTNKNTKVKLNKNKAKTNKDEHFALTTNGRAGWNGTCVLMVFSCDLFGFNLTPIQNIAFYRFLWPFFLYM